MAMLVVVLRFGVSHAWLRASISHTLCAAFQFARFLPYQAPPSLQYVQIENSSKSHQVFCSLQKKNPLQWLSMVLMRSKFWKQLLPPAA